EVIACVRVLGSAATHQAINPSVGVLGNPGERRIANNDVVGGSRRRARPLGRRHERIAEFHGEGSRTEEGKTKIYQASGNVQLGDATGRKHTFPSVEPLQNFQQSLVALMRLSRPSLGSTIGTLEQFHEKCTATRRRIENPNSGLAS